MELKTHEDTKGHSQVKLKFHFMFEMIKKNHKDYLKNFDWDINSNPV